MGWSDCGTDDQGRPIGYAFAATCDRPGCDAKIDRGLSYCCGSMHGGGRSGCGLYFCAEHLHVARVADDAEAGRSYEGLCPECFDAWARDHPEAAAER